MLKKAVELSNAIFLKTDGRTCSLMSDSVDFVYCFLVLQHVPKKSMIELMVGEWHRILKPGGIVRAQTLCCPPPTNEEFNGFAGHSYSSGQDFFDLFKDAGFSVSEQHSGGLNDSPVTDATAKTGDWMWITAQKT
jgi:ubiquinone/menaquinone biosynthesis C-methylase UbiE